jgi:hypothetical protein
VIAADHAVPAGILTARRQDLSTSVTRSLITGKVRTGVIVSVSSGVKTDIRVMQASRAALGCCVTPVMVTPHAAVHPCACEGLVAEELTTY